MGTAALLSIAAMIQMTSPGQPVAAASCVAVPEALRAAISARPASAAAVRVAERVSVAGEYLGRTVEIKTSSGKSLELDLPAESSVGAVHDNVVTYTRVQRGRSEVHAIDAVIGCDYVIAQPSGVVRSALIDSSGDAVYVHAVAGRDRADAGVTRHAIGGGPAVLVVPPLPVDDRFGPTFGTQLAWGVDGTTLAVQSCGFAACRTRLLDTVTGEMQVIDDRPHGALIGVTSDHVVAHEACHWQPCAVLSIERATGTVAVLHDEAYEAALVTRADGRVAVRIETTAAALEVLP
jgi:hypothetical protein